MPYNPTQHTTTNKPLGLAQAVPTDARSYFYDEVNLKYRPYVSTDEVKTYLNTAAFRSGNFPIYINLTGSLSQGVITGGTTWEFRFKDGTNDNNLVLNTVDITSLSQDSTHRFVTDSLINTWNAKQAPISITTTGTSGPATFVNNVLNIPNYTASGGGGDFVPLTRTITINGTTLDLSQNRSFTVSAPPASDYSANIPVNWVVATKKNDGTNITDADVDEILFSKQGSTYYKRHFTGPAMAEWWGAKPNTGLDQYTALQTAVDACINARINALQLQNGYYDLSEGLVIKNGSDYVFLSIYGDGNAYDPIEGGGTYFRLHDPLEAAIYIQRGKGCTIKNIRFQGENNIIVSLAQISNPDTPFSTWFVNGTSSATTAPHAAIVIDALFNAGVPTKYPKKAHLYTEVTNAGSTSIRIQDCYIFEFAVGVCISPAGMQNGENIFIDRCWFGKVYTSISTGDSQNRTVHVRNYTNWGFTYSHFDSETWARSGSGCPPFVDGFNIAGGSTYMCVNGTWYGNEFVAMNGHVELMSRIGGNKNGQLGKITLYNCHLDLMGALNESGSHIPNPAVIVQCETFMMNSGRIVYYSTPQAMFGLSCKAAYLVDVQLTSPAWMVLGQGILDYKISKLDSPDAYMENITITPGSTRAALAASVNPTNNTWKYTPSDTTGIAVGDHIIIYPKDGSMTGEFTSGNILYVPAGRVTDITAGVVTVSPIPYGMANGQSYDITPRKVAITPV